jgi:hypothetical protein
MSAPEQNASADERHIATNQTLLRALNERVHEADDDGFKVVMPVGEWIDAQVWPASGRAAEAEEGEAEMPTIAAWHSPRAEVHHDNKGCAASRRIKSRDLRRGSGGRPLCPNCKRLDTET